MEQNHTFINWIRSAWKSFSGRQMVLKAVLAVTVIMLFLAIPAEATHFRYGNISWSRVNDASRTVTFTVTSAWRRSFYSPTPVVGSVYSVANFFYGDGSSQTLSITVTSVNIPEDWFVGVATLVHTYPGATPNFTAYFEGCCRVSTLQNNGDLGFRSQTSVSLTPGNLGSPVSTMPAIINLPVNQAAAAFNVPAYDPDGHALTYALAPGSVVTQSGSSPVCANPAGLSINPTTGQASFNTVGKTINQMWNAFFSITDANGSVTYVDFIMRMVAANTPPIFDYSVTPPNNYLYSINPGQNLSFDVKASCPDAGSTVTLTAVGLPTTNYSFTPSLPVTANPVASTFSFTPGIAQLGAYVMTFTATRNGGAQTSTSVIVNVNTNPVFVAPTPGEGITYMIPAGLLHQDIIAAVNPDPAVNTRISSASFPAGASVSPSLPTSFGATATTTLSWTPSAADFGPHPVTFTAVDANGRTSDRSYILWPNSLPAFTSAPAADGEECKPFSFLVTAEDPDFAFGDELEIGAHSPLPSWLTLTDNGDGTATLAGTPSHGDAGTYAIDFIAEDLWHHAHSDVIQGFVLVIAADNTPPAPDNAILPVITGECFATVAAPTATDLCAGSITGSTSDPTTFSAQGTYVVTWRYDDGNGNSSSQQQTVVIDDITAPVPDLPDLPTVTADCSASLIAPTATDLCAGIITGTSGDPIVFSAQGTYSVTWNYDDGNGNVSSQVQTVIIRDMTPPVAQCKNYILNLSGGSGTLQASDVDDGSFDNCGIASMSVSPNTFSCTDAGDHAVELSVTDGAGMTSVCTATVTVQYVPSCSITAIAGAGAFTGGPPTTIYLGYGPQTVTLSATASGGSDFSWLWTGLSPESTALLSCTTCPAPVFTPTSEGRYEYTLTVTNSNGCSSTCAITICVLDVRVPGSGGKKVYLCHVPPGNPGNPQTLSISVNAVPGHIPGHAGDRLGTCSKSCESLGLKADAGQGELIVSPSAALETIVYPNPFATEFSVTIESDSDEPVALRILDLAGKLVGEVTDAVPHTTVKLGSNLNDGFYVLRVQQGAEVQNIKIIKRR